MENAINNKEVIRSCHQADESNYVTSNLSQANVNEQYIIKRIKTTDMELKNFLFTLGCYEGEEVTVLSVLAENYIITVKDARYSIDKELAEAIII